jgi:hypothetical protein
MIGIEMKLQQLLDKIEGKAVGTVWTIKPDTFSLSADAFDALAQKIAAGGRGFKVEFVHRESQSGDDGGLGIIKTLRIRRVPD